MMKLRWKNQEEEKSREEGKNGELDTHGAGKSLRMPALKTRRKGSVRALNTQVCRVTGKFQRTTPKIMHVKRTRMPVRLVVAEWSNKRLSR